MAARRTTRNVKRRAAGRDAAAERWLLLIFVVAALIIVAGLLDNGAVVPEPARARRMTMAEARTSNAAVPIVASARRRAAPFRFRGGPAARAQAVDCLATAALYEAGDDPRGQRAVIQVVLNRARAPGFPRTICGVVYQGFERMTGCQFSFTCDGSVERRTRHVGWSAARRAARGALAGRVFADVGRATHYHADWMVPYWRDTMTKVARVDTHLFYVRR
ncbi:cell wall hydrolase [Sphingomonas sp. NPDC079357]|jgi:spore germination cell wall hydrolase CwlJ-like protein|uniref:cell wall hydrolase n=1 Tax=Sphingomonas sp. NPDC079357 TaxID=3364518 RepID=UPI0038506F39